ncbi:Oidioi.mRNA.OKI2018_I69.chr2.g5259.t1.cds [Oikopleura dioica]|uniref:Oidioi.mRNA.OKI2018_I69.chr2.g5259.t1.cds n=1 Tax=Oikopleura dioica TaxID=34765 RepID=A0ABN7T1I2_OIKDI|nr:Oidioi.mRNA.OKI2018_I69.chr2.g5259.t1.cds [Oikopleura dioica]
MGKFWKKFRCCCRSKDVIEPTIFHERVIDEGDDNPAFQEPPLTATIKSPTKSRSSVYIDTLEKNYLRSPPNGKSIGSSELQKENNIVNKNYSSTVSEFSSVKVKDDFSDINDASIMTGFLEEELSRQGTPIFNKKDRKKKQKKERYKASTLRISPSSISSSSSDDTVKERKIETLGRKRKRPDPTRTIVLTGKTQSKWKNADVFGVYTFVEFNGKYTTRPLYLREQKTQENRNVYLFYKETSEKWCIGPDPKGDHCWIYCDSTSSIPTARSMSAFWCEHVGGGQWEKCSITVSIKK